MVDIAILEFEAVVRHLLKLKGTAVIVMLGTLK